MLDSGLVYAMLQWLCATSAPQAFMENHFCQYNLNAQH